jgi:hypothetical protein
MAPSDPPAQFVIDEEPPPLPPLPPAPVAEPEPPTRFTVVVLPEAGVWQVICVALPSAVLNANHPPFGAMYCAEVEVEGPRLQ